MSGITEERVFLTKLKSDNNPFSPSLECSYKSGWQVPLNL